MDNVREEVQFHYNFCDQDEGTQYTVTNRKCKDALTAEELCEAFVDFMKAASYSEQSIFKYFKDK